MGADSDPGVVAAVVVGVLRAKGVLVSEDGPFITYCLLCGQRVVYDSVGR